MSEPLTAAQFLATGGVEDWRVVGDGACAYFRTESFASGARLVHAISELPGLEDHRPDIDLRHDGVTVRLFTTAPAPDGLSARDAEFAQQISAVADTLGLTAGPSAVQNVQVSIDALAPTAVLPFWRGVLGYVDRAESSDELNDPRGRGPIFYFQQMETPRPQRNRIHIDVWVPHDQAEARIAAAIAAGGRLVTDQYAPSWWVLADAEGNEACVATCMNSE